VCAIPFSLSSTAAAGRGRKLSLRIRIILNLIQSVLLLAVAISLGLWSANLMGLGAPVLRALLSHRPISHLFWPMLLPAVVCGVIGSVIALLGDFMFFADRLPLREQNLASTIPFWQSLLASFYGGITEEIFTRLFVFSSLAWFLSKALKAAGALTDPELWLVNLVVAVIFGLGHLPLTRTVMGLTPLTITRALVLNGVPSLIFGWLYWRFGLEAAMISHFCADVIIQSAGFIRGRI
jgi:hypothetical protein